MQTSRLGVLCLLAACALSAPALAQSSCPNPNGIGITRTVEIDTTGGPGFGLEQYKSHDFLLPKEIVLTFDDGPWTTTSLVLDALDKHCTKATFFTIGKHATYYPEILRKVAAAGHTIGTHTWSHANLRNKKIDFEKAKEEIEKGISAVKLSMGVGTPAPFFRFPALQDPPELVKYLGTRNIAIFSINLDSFDFKIRKTDGVIKNVMRKLEKKGKGIVLLHDFQKHTAAGVDSLLKQLKDSGYKVVHMRAKFPVTTLAEYDAKAKAEIKGPVTDGRPTSSVVRTVAPGK